MTEDLDRKDRKAATGALLKNIPLFNLTPSLKKPSLNIESSDKRQQGCRLLKEGTESS